MHRKTPIFCVKSVKNATFSRKISQKCQFFALNLSKFTPARKIYTDGVGRVGDNYRVCHGGDGEKMILLMLMMVMNTWTTRVNGTSCTYDDDEGDIYRGVLE